MKKCITAKSCKIISDESDVDNNGFGARFIHYYFNITICCLPNFFLLNYIIYEKQILATGVINLSLVSIQVNNSVFLELIIQHVPFGGVRDSSF